MINAIDKSDWLVKRQELLETEKALQRLRDDVATQRRELQAYRIEASYEFESASGKVSLPEMFAEHSQLLVYHFMFHPDWDEGCKSCSFWADSFDAMAPHLAARDAAFAVISRAPIEKLESYRRRMNWRFPWVSSANNGFNFDFGVSFSSADLDTGKCHYNYRNTSKLGPEMPGVSVFRRDDNDEVYHSYSSFSRGLDTLNPVYQYLDLLPKGRDEDELAYPMDWLRRHDDYSSQS